MACVIDGASPVIDVGASASETSSTSATAVTSAQQPDNAAIMLLCQDMFKKISDYVAGEFDSMLSCSLIWN